jgi:hypothetical protein
MENYEKQNPVYDAKPYTGDAEASKEKGLKFLLVLFMTTIGAFATAAFATFAAAAFIARMF